MRLLICGGRNYNNKEIVYKTLNEIHAKTPIALIIHGACSGADKLAESWGKQFSNTVSYNAEWDKYGKSAGPIRNQKMIDEGKPDLIVGFPGGKGTDSTINKGRLAGIKIMIVKEGENKDE